MASLHPTRWVVEGDRIMDRNDGKPFWMTVQHAMRRMPGLLEIATHCTGALRTEAFRDIDDLVTAIDQATVHPAPIGNVVAFNREGAAA